MNEMILLLANVLWRPVFPVAVVFALVFVAVASSVFAYWRLPRISWWRRTLLAGLRLTTISLLALIVLGPSRSLDMPSNNIQRRLFIMADVSESMLTEDQSGHSRLEQMQQQWLSNDFLQRSNTSFTIEPYQFAEQPLPIPHIGQPLTVATNEETLLVRSVSGLISSLKNSSGDSLLLLSDGIDSEDASISRISVAAQAKKLEVHTVAFGEKSSTPDAALMATTMQESLYPNESGSVVARVYQVGCLGKKTMLIVKQGESKQRFPVDFSNRDSVEIKIPVRHEETGQYEYQCSLAALPGEKELGNNLQSVFVTVQPKRIRVLLIEGSPNWDSKFIAQSLRKDERIALTQLSQITPDKRVTIITRSDDPQSTFRVPETADEWAHFDVVLLGQNVENVLSKGSTEALVTQYNDTGISIVFARGRAADPDTRIGRSIAKILSKIEPVTWGKDKIASGAMSITPSGKIMQWFSPTRIGLDVESALSRLSGFHFGCVIDEVSPVARVIAESQISAQAGDKVPAIVTRTNQTGSIVTFAGDGLWKWSLLDPDNQDLAGFYDSFWSNLVRWLAIGGDFQPGEEASMRLSRANIRVGEKLILDVALKRALASGADPVLTIKVPDGSAEQVPLRSLLGNTPRLRGTFAVESAGVHEAYLESPGLTPESLSRKFHAYDATLERLNTGAKPVNLKMIAEQSNGRFYGSNDCDKFLKQLKADQQAAKVPPRMVYIWDQGWLMVLIVMIAGCEWIGRKIGGLI